MKKLFIGFLALSFITFGFIVFVFRGDHPIYSLAKKSYVKQLKIVEQQFVNQLKKTESDVYNSFLQNQLNIRIIQNILKKDIPVNNEINFVKFRDDLINFSIFNQDQKLLYQIEKQNNYLQYLDSFSAEKKIFNTPNGFTIFQIPYENNLQSGILLFEFNTYNFLQTSLNTISQNLTSEFIVLPKILILDKKPGNEGLTKKLITNNLGGCLETKQICDIYIRSLQKRLLVDSNKYLNTSVGILYPSNPMDIPLESTLIIFILLTLTALTLLLIFFVSFKKRTSTSAVLALSNDSSEAATEMEPTSDNISDDEHPHQEIIEVDTYVNPSEIPDLGADEEKDEENIPEIQPEIFNKSKTSNIPADSALSSLHQEINTNVTNVVNEKDLKEAYKKLSFALIKNLIPKPNIKEAQATLTEFPYAESLILLELKGNKYQTKESLNVDEHTNKNCSIEKDHPLIKNYLSKRKGLLIHDFSKTDTLLKDAFSDQEKIKIKSLFMFSFNASKSKYIFLIY